MNRRYECDTKEIDRAKEQNARRRKYNILHILAMAALIVAFFILNRG